MANNKDDDLTRIEDMDSFEHEDESDAPPFEEPNFHDDDTDFSEINSDQEFGEESFQDQDTFDSNDNFQNEEFGGGEFEQSFEQEAAEPDLEDSFYDEPTDPNIIAPSEPNFGGDFDQEAFSENIEQEETEQAYDEDDNHEAMADEQPVFQELTRDNISKPKFDQLDPQLAAPDEENENEDEGELSEPTPELESKETEAEAKKETTEQAAIKIDLQKVAEASQAAKNLVIHSNILDKNKTQEKAKSPSIPSPPSVAPDKKVLSDKDKFAYANVAAEGNPAFSIILKDIKFKEDVEDILILLKEFNVILPSDEEKTKAALNRGSFLIPRIGEYVAIYLCQKLRKFNLNILMGLSDEIHASDLYDRHEEIGITSKENVFQNRKDYIDFVQRPYGVPENIIVSTSNQIENYKVLEHLGVITEYTIIDTEENPHYLSMEDKLIEQTQFVHQDGLRANQLARSNRESADSSPKTLSEIFNPRKQTSRSTLPNINDLYKELTEKLRYNAVSSGANGIIGISFHITPVFSQKTHSFDNKYRITATGNLVWLKKK